MNRYCTVRAFDLRNGGPWRLALASILTAALGFFGVSACSGDDGHDHHHVCDPECSGGEICQHGGVCGVPCTDLVSPTICETYIPGEVHYCHAESGMCEPFGETCTFDDVVHCADFQICQLYVEAGTCAAPCQEVGQDAFCQLLNAAYVCHADAGGGLCGPKCTDAGGTVECSQLPPTEPGDTLACNASSGVCEGS